MVRMTRRLIQLFLGLALYGFSIGLMVRSGLGLDPWDVFHQGVGGRAGWSIGTVVIVVGAFVLLMWVPLRQRPGIGTISNVFVIGIAVDLALAVLPPFEPYPLRVVMLIIGTLLIGIASGAYIGAGLGPGPRDGLMTGIVARTGWPIRRVRTGIELTVLAAGWLMGGTVGLGTVFFAVAIGPIVQFSLPLLNVRDQDEETREVAPRDGFEPSTNRLTAGCSTAELPGNTSCQARPAS